VTFATIGLLLDIATMKDDSRSGTPLLIRLTASAFRCSHCDNWMMTIEREKSRRSEDEWQQFVDREFAEHVGRRHAPAKTARSESGNQ